MKQWTFDPPKVGPADPGNGKRQSPFSCMNYLLHNGTLILVIQ